MDKNKIDDKICIKIMIYIMILNNNNNILEIKNIFIDHNILLMNRLMDSK
jgi:hypothetical protein